MAIIQRRLTAPRTVVYSEDDALDRPGLAPDRSAFPLGREGDEAHAVALKDHEAALQRWNEIWKGYLETFDLSVLPIRPGCEPTVFLVQSLTTAQVQHIESSVRWGERMLETLAYGVAGITGLWGEDDKGNRFRVEVKRVPSQLGERLSDEVLALFADDKLRNEIWLRVKEACSLSREARKSG